LAQGRLIVKQPSLLHSHWNNTNVAKPSGIGSLNLLVAKLRILFLRISVHKKNAARKQLGRNSKPLGEILRRLAQAAQVSPLYGYFGAYYLKQ